MTPYKTERYYDIDILEAQVAIDEEFDSWLTEFIGARVAAELQPQPAQAIGAGKTPAPVAPAAVPQPQIVSPQGEVNYAI